MIAAAIVLAAVTFGSGATESFESMSALPADWPVNEYTTGVSRASVEQGDAAKGTHFLRLSSSKPNHVRVFIPTTLEPKATYELTAQVRAEGPKPVPALLGVDGSGTTSNAVLGDGKWHDSSLYLRAGQSGKVTLVLSLGWFGNTVAGAGDFDVVKLEKVSAAPSGAPVATPLDTGGKDDADDADVPGPSKAVIPLAALLLGLIIFCGRVLVRGDRVD